MIIFLINYSIDVEKKDNFSATPFDYAKMLGIIPQNHNIQSIKIWNEKISKIEEINISFFEKLINISFSPFILCSQEYIEELMFSAIGHQIENSFKDIDFRKKYFPLIDQSSGDDNLILYKINDKVGYGVFAAKDFQVGDFIVRYGGKLELLSFSFLYNLN